MPPRTTGRFGTPPRGDSDDLRRVKARLDVTGFTLVVDDQHFVHSLRRHGHRPSEAQRGQIAVTEADYARLPQILGDPDEVRPGEAGRRGVASASVVKVIGGVCYRVVVDARTKRRQLAFVTMFKAAAG